MIEWRDPVILPEGTRRRRRRRMSLLLHCLHSLEEICWRE